MHERAERGRRGNAATDGDDARKEGRTQLTHSLLDPLHRNIFAATWVNSCEVASYRKEGKRRRRNAVEDRGRLKVEDAGSSSFGSWENGKRERKKEERRPPRWLQTGGGGRRRRSSGSSSSLLFFSILPREQTTTTTS